MLTFPSSNTYIPKHVTCSRKQAWGGGMFVKAIAVAGVTAGGGGDERETETGERERGRQG
jgi:hypothetical protein